MASGEYPFIDIAALDPVREKFARGASVIVVTTDLARTIWTNGPGAALFGHKDVENAIGEAPGFSKLARRQITALPNFPNIRDNTAVALRIDNRVSSRVVVLQASHLTLPGGDSAIMLAADPAASALTPEVRAQNAISGFTRTGHHAAYLDASGNIIAHTEGFHSLGLPMAALAGLVEEVASETDRIVKKLVSAAGAQFPAGIVRLTDNPASHLLFVVADADADEISNLAQGRAPASTVLREDVQPKAPEDEAVPDVLPTEKPEAFPEARPRESQNAVHAAAQLPAMENEKPVTPRESGVDEISADDSVAAGNFTGRQELPAAGHDNRTSEAPISAKRPVRFVWKTDVDARIVEVSDDFVAAFGERTGAITGYTFAEVAAGLGLDPGGEITSLLKRRDTWSGRSVFWPISNSEMQVPIDLAALPAYDRDRAFKGFRGFGVARMNEALPDPAKRGLSFEGFGVAAQRSDAGTDKPEMQVQTGEPGQPEESPDRPVAIAANDDPFQGEAPAIKVGETPARRETDKVIDLRKRRQLATDDMSEKIARSGLSDVERSAFRQIADRLKRETEDRPANPPPFGKRKHPVGEAEEGRGQEHPQANDAGNSAPDAGPKTLPPEEVPGPPETSAPALRANPVPSAFAGISHLFRASIADHSVLMQLPVPIMIYNETGIRFANTALLTLSGYPDLETLNAEGGVDALFPQDAPPEVAGDGSDESHISAVNRDGRAIPVEAHLHSVEWEGQRSLALSIRVPGSDSGTKPGISGEDLQARVEELVSILDTATDGVVTIAPDMSIRSINRSAEALFGYDSADVVGTPFADLFAMDSRQIAADYVSGLSGDGVASLLNDGREIVGLESHGRFIPMFMTVGKLAGSAGYCAVLRDITQWKQAESELTEARRLAEKSSSQKTEFLARISHEIRTPLNAIIGFSELMLDEKFGPVNNERYRDYLKDINRSGNHVLALVNDLLDISKIEAGEMELDYEAVHLNEALSEAIAMMQPQANRERVIMRSSLASNLPEVVADLRSVRQIALNLLSNAIRYTLAGGQVIVSTTYEADGSIALRVRDTGVGMSQAEIGQALKPFRQISALKRKHDRGTGLGLPLTKAMVEANRANFSISSAPGEGTMVEIVFPPTRVLAD